MIGYGGMIFFCLPFRNPFKMDLVGVIISKCSNPTILIPCFKKGAQNLMLKFMKTSYPKLIRVQAHLFLYRLKL